MYSKTPDILSIPTTLKSEVLTQAELNVLKEKTLYLLAEVGVHFPSKKALEIFSDNGAQVDHESEIVQIPPDLVLKAMSTAPRSFVLGGREERFDLHLDGSCSYLSTDGTGVHVIDLETREKRPSCKEDVALMARICDNGNDGVALLKKWIRCGELMPGKRTTSQAEPVMVLSSDWR